MKYSKYSWKLPQFFVPSNYSLAQKLGSIQVGLTLVRDLSPGTEKSVAYEGCQKKGATSVCKAFGRQYCLVFPTGDQRSGWSLSHSPT